MNITRQLTPRKATLSCPRPNQLFLPNKRRWILSQRKTPDHPCPHRWEMSFLPYNFILPRCHTHTKKSYFPLFLQSTPFQGAADVRPRDQPTARPASSIPFAFISTTRAPRRRLTPDELEVYESLSDHGYGPTPPYNNSHFVNKCKSVSLSRVTV